MGRAPYHPGHVYSNSTPEANNPTNNNVALKSSPMKLNILTGMMSP